MSLHPQRSGPGNCLGPAALVEAVTVAFVNLLQHRERPFSVDATHQRLIGKNRMVPKVYDRLVGERKIEPQRFALLAAHAPLTRRGE